MSLLAAGTASRCVADNGAVVGDTASADVVPTTNTEQISAADQTMMVDKLARRGILELWARVTGGTDEAGSVAGPSEFILTLQARVRQEGFSERP